MNLVSGRGLCPHSADVSTREEPLVMKRNRKHFMQAAAAFLMGSVLLSTACSSFRTEVGHPLKPPSTPLVEGQTRFEAVLADLGPPHAISALPDGFVLLYEYSRVSDFQWGISLKLVDLPFFKLVKGNSRLLESALLFTFDEQGRLRGQASATWGEPLSGGSALQFIVSAVSLTDTSGFRRIPEPLLWGRGLMRPLPVVLNSAQDLRGGEEGVQQEHIAPAFAGQTSLEMSRPKPLKVRRQKSRR